ncbi:probable inactive purple acid phosphatase 29 [Papaver somniferum]|uniref:probable inactive purple acid phosphatase 29 n=1 Tax=Papaver somniferum TaxID=3469 RepID=UPI000E6FAFC5|nr:probable inactive purple acid phosphatase 29 [Papaver somniferum]
MNIKFVISLESKTKTEKMGLSKKSYLSFSLVLFSTIFVLESVSPATSPLLKFKNGEFKILQVADMHYADGITTPCEDVLEMKGCSDLNTTAFINRMIKAEKPDLIVFTGDNIFGQDATDAAKSLDAAFAPAIVAGIPWAAVLGNHDMESTLTREGVMKHIAGMQLTLSQLNPASADVIDGFGNYNLEVAGAEGSNLQNKTVLNLYFLDTGDYSTVPSIGGYGWIKASQQFWYQKTSLMQQKAYMSKPEPQKAPAPGLAYFHIPLPEYEDLGSNFTGVKGEGLISSPLVNSGFFTTLRDAGDVKAVFTGHDHLNDFCGELSGIHLCYAGGFGYHAYGLKGWSRRARVVSVSLEKTKTGKWGAVNTIRTWKRLDDENLTTIDPQVLFAGNAKKRSLRGI